MTVTEESSIKICALHITSFGDIPLIVLSAGHEDPIPSLSDAEYQNWMEELKAQQSELAALSPNSNTSSRNKAVTSFNSINLTT